MTDEKILSEELRNCPPHLREAFIEANYKKRLPGGGWISPLNKDSIDVELAKEYLKNNNIANPEPADLAHSSKPPQPGDWMSIKKSDWFDADGNLGQYEAPIFDH